MRIFPDANVWVAAFMWEKGVCGKIVQALLEEKQHDLIVGEWVLEEAKDTLHDDFSVPPALTSEFENLLCRGERSFRQETPLALSPYRVEDPDDAVVLASALTAEADVLVTGDKALLNLAEAIRQAEGLLIIHPATFWQAKGSLW